MHIVLPARKADTQRVLANYDTFCHQFEIKSKQSRALDAPIEC